MAQPIWTLDQIVDNFFRGDDEWSPSITSLSFSFPTTRPSGYSAVTGEGKGFSTLGLEQRSWATAAFDLWEDVVDIDFVDLGNSDDGDIRIMNTDTHSPGGVAYAKDGSKFGDIWIFSDVSSNFAFGAYTSETQTFLSGYGSRAMKTLIHEIGHALGLEHPGNYNADDEEDPTYASDALYMQDTHQYTIMSYFGEWETGAAFNFYNEATGEWYYAAPQTPMLHDILAVQARYGANMTTRVGNTVYGYNSNAGNPVYDFDVNPNPVLCIWDAGGIDELNLSGSGFNQIIDLAPGAFTSALGGLWNISIAYDAWIEKARAGSGNDRVIGNILNNTLRGGDGEDSIYGLQGNDSLIGADDDDRLYGHTGQDTLWGGEGHDLLHAWTGNDELNGEAGNDTLDGGEGEDILRGGTGDDVMTGGFGDDMFFGDSGFDRVSFRYSSSDWLIDLAPASGPAYAAANGSSELLSSIEAIEGSEGDDTIYGTNSANLLMGDEGNDRLHGRLGNDSFEGGWGIDTIYRGDGDHLIDGGQSLSDLLDCWPTSHAVDIRLYNKFSSQLVYDAPGTANDEYDFIKDIEDVNGTAHNDRIEGGIADNTLQGQSGDDLLRGWSGRDSLFGGFGNDTLEGDSGNDTVDGGSGYDLASYAGRYGAVNIDLTATGWHTIGGGGDMDKLFGIEGLIGSNYADMLKGTDGYNMLIGNDGNDTIEGRGGPDSIDGGDGHDWLKGGTGEDTIAGGGHNDIIEGEASNDTLAGGDGQDDIEGGSGDDWIYGDGGHDTLAGGTGSDGLFGFAGNDVLTGGSGNDTIAGHDGYDVANYAGASSWVAVDLSLAGAQLISAGEGWDALSSIEGVVGSNYGDALRGTDGSDKLFGLGGNDVLEGRLGNDILDGGMGIDTVSFESATAGVIADLSNVLPQNTQAGIDSFISIEGLMGSNFADILRGDFQDNRLMGLDGDDWLFGGDGEDWVRGGNGNDLMFGGAGNDSILGDAGNDTVSYFFTTSGVTVTLTTSAWQATGGAGSDRLFDIENLTGSIFADELEGNGANNRLNGLGGADILRGGAGLDTLTGGAGADLFDFDLTGDSTSQQNLADLITDFAQGEDRIDFSGIDATGSTAGDGVFVFRGQQGFNGEGQLRYAYNAAQDVTVVAINTLGNSGAEMTIRLAGNIALTEADFML
jgi:Ca2+-binding RTX toxin-like protein